MTGPSTTFTWAAGSGVTSYVLAVGSAQGLANYFSSGVTTATSVQAIGLPANGSTLYARLSSLIDGSYQYVDYVFTAATLAADPLTLSIPAHHTIDAPFTIAATSPSTGAIIYSLIGGPATLSGNQVTLTGQPGSVTIEADQAAADSYAAASVQASFSVIAGSSWIFGNSIISVFDLTGAPIAASGYTDAAFTGSPVVGAFDSHAQLWLSTPAGIAAVSDQGLPGNASPITTGGIDKPSALAIDGRGNVWIANLSGNSVSELNNSGTALSPPLGFLFGQVASPQGIAIDLSGNIWLTSGTANVTELLGAATPVLPIATAVASGTPATTP